MLELNVQQAYFDAILKGSKNIEGRLAKEKYLNLKKGDKIRFFNNEATQSTIKTVTALHLYPSFEAAFKQLSFNLAVPGAKDTKEALDIYEQFYSKSMQLKDGVVFIEIT